MSQDACKIRSDARDFVDRGSSQPRVQCSDHEVATAASMRANIKPSRIQNRIDDRHRTLFNAADRRGASGLSVGSLDECDVDARRVCESEIVCCCMFCSDRENCLCSGFRCRSEKWQAAELANQMQASGFVGTGVDRGVKVALVGRTDVGYKGPTDPPVMIFRCDWSKLRHLDCDVFFHHELLSKHCGISPGYYGMSKGQQRQKR